MRIKVELFLDENEKYRVVSRLGGDELFRSSPPYPSRTIAVQAAIMRARDKQLRWPTWHEEGSVLLFEYKPWVPPAGTVIASFCSSTTHPKILLREGVVGPNGEHSTGLCTACTERVLLEADADRASR